jgi:hypothetical protein
MGGKLRRLPQEAVRALEMPGGYTLGEQGLEVRGFPSLEQHEAVGLFIDRVNEAGGWWKTDWLDYAETRVDWKEEVEEMASPATRTQYRHIRKMFPLNSRIKGASFSHHAIVAQHKLAPGVGKQLLEAAATAGWTTRELARATKQAQHGSTTVIEGQAIEVFEVEVGVLVTVEAQTGHLAEGKAWDALKRIVPSLDHHPPILKARVILAHARPKLTES